MFYQTARPRAERRRFLTTVVASAALLLPALAASAQAQAGDWPTYRGSDLRSGVADSDLSVPLSMAWRHTTRLNPNNPVGPISVGDTVYFASGGTVYAVDAANGALRWRYPREGEIDGTFRSTPALVGDQLLIGATNGTLYSLDARTGQPRPYQFRTTSAISSPITVEEGVVYFGASDGHVYALDAQTLQPIWPRGLNVRNPVSGPVTVHQGRIYFIAENNMLYAVAQATGREIWRQPYTQPVYDSTAVIADGGLYVAAGNLLDARLATSGRPRWRLSFQADLSGSPAVADGVVYAATRDGHVWAFQASNGRKVWSETPRLDFEPQVAPTLAGGHVIVGTRRRPHRSSPRRSSPTRPCWSSPRTAPCRPSGPTRSTWSPRGSRSWSPAAGWRSTASRRSTSSLGWRTSAPGSTPARSRCS